MVSLVEQPEVQLAVLMAIAVLGVGFYRLILWCRGLPTSPDPWDADIEKSLHEPDATPVCHKCFSPQPAGQWFCAHCGSAVGDYNNWMPYIYVFSEGEVLRNGVTEKVRVNALVIVGYLLLSLNYFVLAPVYWYFFFKNLRKIKTENVGPEAPGES
jgi:hypothetical protein